MTLKRELLQDEEFVTLDTDGNRMYTSGLNRYIDFVEGQYFTAIADPLRLLDQPLDVRQSRRTSAREVPSRDSIIVRQVIIAERHRCLVNEEHLTFTSARYGTPYMEGHHLIPLRDQHRFYYSLDVYANIVPLCPICHRLLHHAVTEERKPVWQQLFTLRQDRLADSGLRMSTREFIEFMEQQAPVSSVVY